MFAWHTAWHPPPGRADTALIGVGGMGEVYKATDTNLKRVVAILVAADAERLARFQREADVLALNHPNIAQIHGLEHSDGITALVMELVEGDDLSQRIAKRAIPRTAAGRFHRAPIRWTGPLCVRLTGD